MMRHYTLLIALTSANSEEEKGERGEEEKERSGLGEVEGD